MCEEGVKYICVRKGLKQIRGRMEGVVKLTVQTVFHH